MKNKVLVIPGPFVPYNDTLTLLNYKRLSHLDAEYDVLAIGGKIDESLEKELSNDDNFAKFKIKRILDYKKMDIVHNPFCIFYFFCAYFIYRYEALKLAKENNYNIIYTSSHPGMAHLIGKKIKSVNPDIRWIASFSDPIKGSPYKHDPKNKKRSMFYRFAFAIGAFFYAGDFYEKAAIEKADNLVFICDEQRDFTCGQYKNKSQLISKSIIVPLAIEQNWDMYSWLFAKEEVNNKPLVASHLGRIYGLRKIDNFLIALKELKDEGKITRDIIRFYQYDEIDDDSLQTIKELELDDLFIVRKKVTYENSIEIMKKSDILLLFDTIMEREKIQPYLPSKIIEYLVLKKSILGVCGKNSPSYRMLKEYGFNTVGTSKDSIKANVVFLLENRKVCDYKIEDFYVENNINELKKIIE